MGGACANMKLPLYSQYTKFPEYMYLAPNALSSMYPQTHTIGYITTYNVHICGGGEPHGLVGNGWYACSLITDSSGDYKPSMGKQMPMLLDLFRKSPKLWGGEGGEQVRNRQD